MSARSTRLVVWLCCSLVLAEQKPRMLEARDARRLVWEALPQQAKRLPGIDIVPGHRSGPEPRLTFDVVWANPGPGSFHVDFYTVDLRTGALWRGVLCEPVATPRVARIQQELRKRLGITESEYRKALDRNLCLE